MARPSGTGGRTPAAGPETSGARRTEADITRLRFSPTLLAVVLALAGAATYGLASALQYRETIDIAGAQAPGGNLIGSLLHRPWWLAGALATAIGAGLHVMALAYGSLAVVQPLDITSLVFALMISAALRRDSIPATHLLAAISIVVGIVIVFASLEVHRDAPHISGTHALWLLGAVVALVLAFVIGALLLVRRPRAFAFAAAAAVSYGAAAALIHVVARQPNGLRHGDALLVMILLGAGVLAVAGLAISQHAFEAGALSASLPMLTIGNPLVAIGLGAIALHEPVRITAGRGLMLLPACAMTGVGVLVLSRERPR